MACSNVGQRRISFPTYKTIVYDYQGPLKDELLFQPYLETHHLEIVDVSIIIQFLKLNTEQIVSFHLLFGECRYLNHLMILLLCPF